MNTEEFEKLCNRLGYGPRQLKNWRHRKKVPSALFPKILKEKFPRWKSKIEEIERTFDNYGK